MNIGMGGTHSETIPSSVISMGVGGGGGLAMWSLSQGGGEWVWAAALPGVGGQDALGWKGGFIWAWPCPSRAVCVMGPPTLCLLEPAILVMHHSMKPHPAITATLLDFMCRVSSSITPIARSGRSCDRLQALRVGKGAWLSCRTEPCPPPPPCAPAFRLNCQGLHPLCPNSQTPSDSELLPC